MAEILDSGERREFDSGAVRDIQEGKGRCDLLPLDVVANFFDDDALREIFMFQMDGCTQHLYDCMKCAIYGGEMFVSEVEMMLEIAKHFENGAKKYGECNWQKGIPIHCYIDSAVRHYFKWMRGDEDERHDRAFMWNIMCAVWTMEHKPDMNDFAGKTSN